MTLAIDWNGKTYDVDPNEFTVRELDLIEQKTGLNWSNLLLTALRFQPNAIRALFWLVDQRDQPDLKFSSYEGPPMKVWTPHVVEWAALVDDLGKLVKAANAASGSADSPSTVDTHPSSTTG